MVVKHSEALATLALHTLCLATTGSKEDAATSLISHLTRHEWVQGYPRAKAYISVAF
jgi:hypothetical protein